MQKGQRGRATLGGWMGAKAASDCGDGPDSGISLVGDRMLERGARCAYFELGDFVLAQPQFAQIHKSVQILNILRTDTVSIKQHSAGCSQAKSLPVSY